MNPLRAIIGQFQLWVDGITNENFIDLLTVADAAGRVTWVKGPNRAMYGLFDIGGKTKVVSVLPSSGWMTVIYHGNFKLSFDRTFKRRLLECRLHLNHPDYPNPLAERLYASA